MNKSYLLRLTIGFFVLIVFFLALTGFQVPQGESAVVTNFGKPIRVINQPGFFFKWPWPFESVSLFDTRLNVFEIRISEALTRDKRNIIVPIFVLWKIVDPLKFLEALGSMENAVNKLDTLVGSAKNTLLGSYDFSQLVSIDPAEVRLDELEKKILSATASQAAVSFGIQIEQIGIKRLTLPEVNTRYVFQRMTAERAQFAARYRAEGRQKAAQITARTNTEKTLILSRANKDAEEMRGKAEAEAARIYAEAHNQSPDFYKFLRGIEVLKKSMNANTTLVIDTNSSPFDLLKRPPVLPPKT